MAEKTKSEMIRADGAEKAVSAILLAIDQLAESQRKELNGNPLTDGRYQGIKKCGDIIRLALLSLNQRGANG